MWQDRIRELLGRPVGVAFRDGTGTSGVLCGVRDRVLYIMEYMYRDQFALKQYGYNRIQDVNGFPPCGPQPRPGPRPRPPVY